MTRRTASSSWSAKAPERPTSSPKRLRPNADSSTSALALERLNFGHRRHDENEIVLAHLSATDSRSSEEQLAGRRDWRGFIAGFGLSSFALPFAAGRKVRFAHLRFAVLAPASGAPGLGRPDLHGRRFL